ncbi:hypothetical protein [Rubrivivax albus]|uniref:Nuclear transport factor 2 family protein n=1 Tax=Rubrivivax albus TaxID=2499835 RepID=A0A437JL94_9BURK|nr:hypothetical protein [Rubrivivax albus]RVT47429.1 hypothetical protein ENE75_24160 [Rubrivivax albus]
MQRRYVLAYAAWTLALAMPKAGAEQAGNADAEAALRQAVSDYLASWNSHEIASWARWLTEDVEWIDPSDPSPKKSKATVTTFASYYVRTYDLDLRIKKLLLASNGKSATVALEGKWLELPQRDGKYSREWARDLLVSRWRYEGDGWRLLYMNNHAGSSAEIAKAEGLN